MQTFQGLSRGRVYSWGPPVRTAPLRRKFPHWVEWSSPLVCRISRIHLWQIKKELEGALHEEACSLCFLLSKTPKVCLFWREVPSSAILSKVWGTRFPVTQDPRASLCVDSAPSCGHGTVNWEWTLVTKCKGTSVHNPERVAAWERLCLGIMFWRRAACFQR